jgi:hypothetical protein
MARRFFRLSDDVYVPQRWHLAVPRDEQGQKVDDWQFRRGTPVSIEGRLRVPVEIAGRPLDFTEYASVRDLRIDRTKVGDARVLRPEGWDVALIVSEEIKDTLERMGATGTRFEEV